MTSEFEQYVLNGPVALDFEPIACLDPDGDCFEFIATNETYRAERLDSLVTVYVGRESHEVVGCQIKGVSKYVQEVLETYPSFTVEIRDGKVRLECLFTLRLCEAYRDPDGTKVRVYKKLLDVAGRAKVEIDLPRRAA